VAQPDQRCLNFFPGTDKQTAEAPVPSRSPTPRRRAAGEALSKHTPLSTQHKSNGKMEICSFFLFRVQKQMVALRSS